MRSKKQIMLTLFVGGEELDSLEHGVQRIWNPRGELLSRWVFDRGEVIEKWESGPTGDPLDELRAKGIDLRE